MKTFRSAALLAAIALTAASAAHARSDGQGGDKPCPDGGGRRGPPPQALEACGASAEGARCTFIGRNDQTINGSCFQVPEGMACVPDDAPRPPRGGQGGPGQRPGSGVGSEPPTN